MKILLLNHGQSYSNLNQLVDSSSGNQDALSPNGVTEAVLSARSIFEMVRGVPADKIFVYSADNFRNLQTINVLANELQPHGKLLDSNVYFDERLNSRNLGELENQEISQVKKKSYFVLKPAAGVSAILAELGFNNSMKIEPRKQFDARVFDAIYDIIMKHEGKNDFVILSASKSVFDEMQKNPDIHSMCYFGNELPPFAEQTEKSQRPVTIKSFKEIELGAPDYIRSSGRFRPYWEARSTSEYILSGMGPQFEQ